MAWEVRNGNPGIRYFYTSIRRGDKVHKRYRGRGMEAFNAAKELEQRKAARIEERRTIQQLYQELWPVTEAMRIIQQSSRVAYHAAHLAAGYWQSGSGNWRRRKTDLKMSTAEHQIEPNQVSLAHPPTLGECVRLIEQGRTELIPALRSLLKSCPELWQQIEDIGQRTQRAWAGLLAGGDVLRREVMLLQAEQLREKLVGDSGSVTTRLMAERVVLLRQQTCYFEQVEASNSVDLAGTRLGKAVNERQQKANRQLADAVRQLGVVKKLQAEIETTRPAAALRIYDPPHARKKTA